MAKKAAQNIIRLQILRSEVSDFQLFEVDDIQFEKLEQKDMNFQVQIHVSGNLADKQLKLDTEVTAMHKSSKSKVFQIVVTSLFHSADIKKIIDQENKIIAPDDFMRKVINISIGGARGMLAVLLADGSLKHLTLPLLDIGSLKKGDK